MKTITLQEITIPSDCRITSHEFYTYDPEGDFSKENNLKYLNEDLFQCVFPEQHLLIDLGWYGDLNNNKGEFRIYIIINENWDFPFNIIHSKSIEEIKELLNKIFKYYSTKNFKV